MLALTVVLVAQLTGAGWSSSRPAECARAELGEGTRGVSNVWERAKSPELGRYCNLLASGAAKLAASATDHGGPAGAGGAREVLAIADEAARAIPSRAAPLVLRGRALARLGLHKDALAAFEEGKRRDERALEDPASLLAWARVLARAGRVDEAAAAYRSLLPRASTLTLADRGAACLEAALLASARGAAGLDEAIADLRQARRDAQEHVQALATLALALTLDRAGARDEARAVLGDGPRGDMRAALADPRVREILTTASAAPEGDAMIAMALEMAGDPAGAKQAWRAYADGASSSGPWAEHARAHLREGGGARRPLPGSAR